MNGKVKVAKVEKVDIRRSSSATSEDANAPRVIDTKKVKKVIKPKISDKEAEIMEALNIARDMRNHSSVCDLYMKISDLHIVCYNIEKSKMMYFNDQTTLWTDIGLNELSMKVSNKLKDLLVVQMEQANSFGIFKKLLKDIGNVTFIQNVSKLLCGLSFDPLFMEKLNGDRTTINFSNGVLDLKKGIFRKRIMEDYVSKCLNFEYTDVVNKSVQNKIIDLILKISNDSEELKEDNLKWFGYCLTGATNEQKFMCYVGHSASNGKSTLSKMFEASLPIYTYLTGF